MTRRKTKLILAALVFGFGFRSTSYATESFCAVTERTPDGFVALREGPGAEFKAKAKAVPSDQLIVATEHCRSDFGPLFCDDKGAWLFVEEVIPVTAPSKSLARGWISARFVRQIGCIGG
jgi:hypothetical protein